MASVGEPANAKRPHIKTERMQEFIKTHGDVSPQKIQKCPHDGCSKVLSSLPGLRYHIQTYHLQVKEFICPKCSRTFKSANGLKYHTGKTKCDDCHGNSALNSVPVQDLNSGTAAIGSYGVVCLPPSIISSDLRQKIDQQERRVPPPLVLTKEPADNLVSSTDGSAYVNATNSSVNDRRDKASVDGITSACTIPGCEAGMIGSLEEFAIFATSPQSPLMQRVPMKPWEKPTGSVVRCLNDCFGGPMNDTTETPQDHSYSISGEDGVVNTEECYTNLEKAELQASPSVDSNGNYFSDGSDPRVTSSSPFLTSPRNLGSPTGTWSHKWPTAVWQCFIEGTRVYFLSESGSEWKKVEHLGRLDSLTKSAAYEGKNHTRYAEHGLYLLKIDHHQDVDNIVESVTQLHFSPNTPEQADLIAECALDHPFFVKDKGWSSYHPGLTAEHYGIPCNILEVGDICLPPSHPDATLGDDMLESFKTYDLTPMDSSAVFTLQNMAKQRRDLELSPKSNTGSPTKKRTSKLEPSKAKRPMNAFMLFAKEFRLEYTQKYPGKDNRAISVMLGDTWKKMSTEERNLYAEKAKSLADLQKKMHPDCWKRKK